MPIKKGDFVQLDYTGKTKENNQVFDTTSKEVAKKHDLDNNRTTFAPVVVVIGENHLIPGLDKQLEGKEPGTYHFDLSPEEGFGKKSTDLLKLVPAKTFAKENIKPFVGLEVELDGSRGIIRNVSAGRVIVDFNHPLSGKELHYDVDVKKIVTDAKEKIEGLCALLKFPVKKVNVENNKAFLSYEQELPEQLRKGFEQELERLVGMKIAQPPKKEAAKETSDTAPSSKNPSEETPAPESSAKQESSS